MSGVFEKTVIFSKGTGSPPASVSLPPNGSIVLVVPTGTPKIEAVVPILAYELNLRLVG